jgi:sulfate transport system permease protein
MNAQAPTSFADAVASVRPLTQGLKLWLDRSLIAVAVVFVLLVVVLPLALVIVEAFGAGAGVFVRAVLSEETFSALALTLACSLVALPLTIVFGIAAAWAVVKCNFPGRSIMLTLIDIPFSISPVVAGMMIVLLIGRQGPLGPVLDAMDIQVLYTPAAIVIALILVTLPFVAREVIPLMQAQGREEEEAALSLGASGWQTLFRVSLPNIRWAMLHGALLAWARAIGDFGAVSIVSGHIERSTMTLPLQVESLHSEFRFTEAFAVATVLIIISTVVAMVKWWLSTRMNNQQDNTAAAGQAQGANHVH